MFYHINSLKESLAEPKREGLSIVKLNQAGKLCADRRIRWRSSNQMHGLIESRIIRQIGSMDFRIRDAENNLSGEIQIERIEEIWLLDQEFSDQFID